MSIPRAAAPRVPSAPTVPVPAGACDSHFHMVAGEGEFPRYAKRVEDPAEGTYDDWLARLRSQMDVLGLERGVIVQSILYGIDNRIVARAIRDMGAGAFRGIGVVADDVSDQELDALRDAGIMGLRMNYVHGGVMSWTGAVALSERLRARGMHIQMLINAHEHMEMLAEEIRAVRVPVILDHIGWPDLARGVQDPGFQTLLTLLGEGHVWVKLSGCFRFCNAPYSKTDAHLAALVEANPDHCLWGSDWPYLMMADAETPDPGGLLDGLYRVVSGATERQKIMTDNPAQLYRFVSD